MIASKKFDIRTQTLVHVDFSFHSEDPSPSFDPIPQILLNPTRDLYQGGSLATLQPLLPVERKRLWIWCTAKAFSKPSVNVVLYVMQNRRLLKNLMRLM